MTPVIRLDDDKSALIFTAAAHRVVDDVGRLRGKLLEEFELGNRLVHIRRSQHCRFKVTQFARVLFIFDQIGVGVTQSLSAIDDDIIVTGESADDGCKFGAGILALEEQNH